MIKRFIDRYLFKVSISIGLTLLILFVFISNSIATYRVSRPIKTPEGVISQGYLWGEKATINGKKMIHRGVDFIYPTGTRVYAVASGKLVDFREDLDNDAGTGEWGNYVIIQHNQRAYDRVNHQNAYVYSMYLHLSKNSVRPSQIGVDIYEGDWIADSDNTGKYTTDPHLHLQIVIHPQPNLTISTLDSENRSRNPEI